MATKFQVEAVAVLPVVDTALVVVARKLRFSLYTFPLLQEAVEADTVTAVQST